MANKHEAGLWYAVWGVCNQDQYMHLTGHSAENMRTVSPSPVVWITREKTFRKVAKTVCNAGTALYMGGWTLSKGLTRGYLGNGN